MHRCDLKDKDEKRAWYQAQINQISHDILALRLSQPALRALVDLQVFNVLDLQQVDRLILKNSHGIGPQALKKLESLH